MRRSLRVSRPKARRNRERVGTHPFLRPEALAAIAAFIASVVPITAAINGYFDTRLEQQKYRSELRLKYLDRALDFGQDPEYREGVLTFLLTVLERNDPMFTWADEQRAKTRKLIRLRQKVEAQALEIRRLKADLGSESVRLEEALLELEILRTDTFSAATEAGWGGAGIWYKMITESIGSLNEPKYNDEQ